MFRPPVFAWAFWAALAATYARQAFDFFGEGGRYGLWLVTLSALALAVAWTVLPWDTDASVRRKLVAPVFLLAVFVFSQFTGSDWALILYLISFSNAVFLFGTRREVEVAGLVGRGMTNEEIARELYISEGTARNHVSSIMKKLDLRDRTRLALYAARRWPSDAR